MKHTTKSRSGLSQAPRKRMIGLRLDEATMAEIEALAATEMRSLADMARICVHHGMANIRARNAAAQTKQ